MAENLSNSLIEEAQRAHILYKTVQTTVGELVEISTGPPYPMDAMFSAVTASLYRGVIMKSAQEFLELTGMGVPVDGEGKIPDAVREIIPKPELIVV